MKKEKFKEDFMIFVKSLIPCTDLECNLLWTFVEPHLKLKESKPKIEIPIDRVVEFNDLFPKGKAGSGKYMRCNTTELTKSFERFFRVYDYTWETIMQATINYLYDQEQERFKWCLRSKYFVTKLKDGVHTSELAESCARVLEGGYFEDQEPRKNFEPRVL